MTETETKISALLNRLPELDGGKMPAIDTDLTNELVQALLKGGKETIAGLIDMLREVDNGSDWKARFLLQAVTMAVGSPAGEPQLQALANILLDEATGSRPPAVRTFLLGRLRLVAGRDAVPKLVALLAADDAPLCDAAAAVLVTIGPPSKEPLEKSLKGAQGRRKAVIENALAQIH